MPTRYTNEEWAKFIGEVERDIVVSKEPYPCPEIGSPAFAKAIDHTLLKLEARSVQFDQLCAEARVDGFAVREHDTQKRRPKLTIAADCLCSPSLRIAMRLRPQRHRCQGGQCDWLPRGYL